VKKEKTKKELSAWRCAAAPGALVLACLALTGCGGGGGSSAASVVSGTVIDGYIEGAEVCLDLNNNQTCDAGEPKATTGKDGGYKLDTTGLAVSQIRAAHLLTVVPETAKDADDNGLTLKDAGKAAFSLMAPTAAYVKADGSAVTRAVISPLTTLVSHDMVTSNTPLATAQSYVRARLSLADGTDLTQDFVAQKDSTLINKAQMLTAALGEVQASAKTAGATDKQALFAALQYLQTQAADLQKAVEAASSQDNLVKRVKTAIATGAAKPAVADLVAEAKKTTDSSSVSSAVALIEQGIYGGEHVLEDCSVVAASCTPVYWKVQGSGGKITLDSDYVFFGGTWTKSSSGGDWVLTSAGWKQQDACASGQSATYSVGSDGVTTVTFCGGNTERIVARMVDAAGKTLSALGLNPPSAYASTTLPAGSQLYWLESANTEDKYYLYAGGNGLGYWDGSKQVNFTSLDALVQNRTGNNSVTWSGLRFSFDAGGTSAGGKLTLWSDSSASTTTTGTYTRRMVGSQEVLIINAQAPDNNKGELIMFAVKDGVVYGGSYRSVAVRQTSNPLFNKTMMNAILAAGKLPNVLD
jgi:hypothetical protein